MPVAIKQSYLIIFALGIIIFCFKTIRITPKSAVSTNQTRSFDNRTESIEGLKTVLLWNKHDYAPFFTLGPGQGAFLKMKCPVNNCYVTNDKNLFGGDITKFDAISFARRKLSSDLNSLPKNRSLHQKYIFYEMESSDNYPLCEKMYDGFFNWTATYKLNSDILQSYILIKKKRSKEVAGPKIDMEWVKDMQKVDKSFFGRFQNKSKAAAWFVSNCKSRNHREQFIKDLQTALEPYGLKIDVYGVCGPLKCPRTNTKACLDMLKRDYYFYMAFENSFSEDYLTEKVLTALFNDVVPVVYGGANYSRFLPPGSYINAQEYTYGQLATLMNKLIQSPDLYQEYFRWRYHYTYHDPKSRENVCNICATLNNRHLVTAKTVYQHIREWWYPNYKDRCKKH